MANNEHDDEKDSSDSPYRTDGKHGLRPVSTPRARLSKAKLTPVVGMGKGEGNVGRRRGRGLRKRF